MYSTSPVFVNQTHEMFEYFDHFCHLANNMYNAAMFRIRQVMTAVKKPESEWQPTQKEVMDEIYNALEFMPGKKMPDSKHWLLGYPFLAKLMTVTKNPDYYAEGFSSQAAQNCLRQACLDMKGWVEACKEYKKHPEKFTGKPKLPGYKKSGGVCSIKLTNQDCYLIHQEDECFLKLPKTNLKLQTRPANETYKLKEVSVKPVFGGFEVRIILDDGIEKKKISSFKPERAACVDLGIRNFASMTNNTGAPCMLFKGGIVNTINQGSAKDLAKTQSEQTKGTTDKFVMTDEARALLASRHNRLSDYMHKAAKTIISFCLEHKIDTLIVGANYFWKQGAAMSKAVNQKFCLAPHTIFRNMLKYLCGRAGIQYIETEESYTSRADFTADDFMPVYGSEGEAKPVFSGRRSPCIYKDPEHKRSSGYHGLYKTASGAIVNSDLNGAANIGRKAFPDLFKNGKAPDFNNVIVIKHPDAKRIKANREAQMSKNKDISKSKGRRNRKKQVIPMG